MESRTCHIEIDERQIGKFASSPLVRTLACGALLLLCFELLFLFLMIGNTMRAENTAAREYQLLKVSEKLSRLASLTREHRRVTDRWVDVEHSRLNAEAHNKSSRNIHESLEDLTIAWNSSGLKPGDLSELLEGYEQFLADTSATLAITDEGEIRKGYARLIRDTKDLYPRARRLMKQVRAFIDKVESDNAKQEQSPLPILFLASAINILLCLLATVWVDRKISRPISDLAVECKNIAKGVEIAAPVELRNDLDLLRFSFHKMSSAVVRDEQGRKAYLSLLKDMQTKSLERAKKGMCEPLFAGAASADGQKRIKQIVLNLDAMIQLLESMREGLSFNQHEDLQINYSTISSEELARSAESAVDALLQKKNIQLELNCDDFSVEVDPQLVGRVIVNFLSNAIKFSERNSSIVLNMVCSCEEQVRGRDSTGVESPASNRLRCEVEDKGPGISLKDQSLLFAKFSQLDSGAKRTGSGLGLMICKQIIESHGGIIGCKSSPGEGSCFWFEIPIQAKPAEKKIADVIVSTQHSKRGSIRNTFVLLLALFVSTQLLVSAAFGFKFSEAAAKAHDYANEKQILVQSEGLLVLFMDVEHMVQSAYREHNFTRFSSIYPLIGKQREATHELVMSSASKPELNRLFRDIEARLSFMQVEGQKAMNNFPNIDMEQLANVFKRCEKLGLEVEELLFCALKLEIEGLDSSYDLGSKIRSQIIMLILFCAAVNTALIGALGLKTAGILRKIGKLGEKTRIFENGGLPVIDDFGKDELHDLDESFCHVARLVRQAEAQRQELMAVINHDLRTPLGSVLSNFELITAGHFGSLSAFAQKEIASIQAELKALLSHLNNLLTLEKAEQGALVPDFAIVDLADLIDELVDNCNSQRKGSDTLIKAIYDENSSYLIQAELELLQMAFMALLSNACSASNGTSTVEVFLDKKDDQITIQVADSGAGIPAELQATIFERFRFLNKQPLPGLGLPLAFRLLALHNAELALVKSTSEGTMFSCTFKQYANK